MANFAQTMKNWRRMCKAQEDKDGFTACELCPLNNGEDGFSCVAIYEDDFDMFDFAKVEQVVTKWAAEHQEIYPTWYEWLNKVGMIKQNKNKYGTSCEFQWDKPIPARHRAEAGVAAEKIIFKFCR